MKKKMDSKLAKVLVTKTGGHFSALNSTTNVELMSGMLNINT